MDNFEPGVEMLAPETLLKTDAENDEGGTAAAGNKSKEDELISLETLRESPVQWPERFPGMDDFMNMSHTPIHTPSGEPGGQHFSAADMAKINQLASLTPEELIEHIKSVQDEIYQLGLRESKEMTRGKLLGIFDRMPNKSKK